jgi:hypothetical protein
MLLFQPSLEPLLLSLALFTDTTALVCPQTVVMKVPAKPKSKLLSASAAVVTALFLASRKVRIRSRVTLHGILRNLHPIVVSRAHRATRESGSRRGSQLKATGHERSVYPTST